MDASKFLEDLSGRHARFYFAAIHDLYVALVRGNKPAARDARVELARVMVETMGAAEILGASMTLESVTKSANFAAEQPILPRVTLTEALEDFVQRAPVTIRNAAERTAQSIAKLYTEDRVVAFVRAAESSVTAEAQNFIARTLRTGIGEGEAGKRLAMSVEAVRNKSAAWSEGYARMVFRTNVNTAVTAGRFRQSQDPDIKAVVPAFRFDAVGDADTRHNHNAADGLVLSVDDTRWNRIAPPLGYNCRCQVSHVDADELRELGLINADGTFKRVNVPNTIYPDPGFRHGGRPDLFVGAQ
jgi:SPP1 gp7 family putative phage head morphogenesis protein